MPSIYIKREKDMTLPKGYKSPSSRQPARPRRNPKKQIVWTIITLIAFFVSLMITYNAYVEYVESGKQVEEAKKQLEKSRAAYEQEFKNTYGYLPK